MNSIRKHRKRLGLSQANLAHTVGITERTLRRAENGGDVRMETLRKISRAMNVPVDLLLTEAVGD